MKKFVLKVEYATGSINMLTNTYDLVKAIEEFKQEYYKGVPNGDKSFGMPTIVSARIEPVLYTSGGVDV